VQVPLLTAKRFEGEKKTNAKIETRHKRDFWIFIGTPPSKRDKSFIVLPVEKLPAIDPLPFAFSP
jgi:hypothetical protein